MKKIVSNPPRTTATKIHQESIERDKNLLNEDFVLQERKKVKTPLEARFLEAEIRIAQYKKDKGLLPDS